jgi:hypothetical protein
MRNASYRKNPANQQEDIEQTLGFIEKNQLENSLNDVDVRELSRDPETPDYSIHGTYDNPADGYPQSNPELTKFPETERFAKEHQPIDPELIKKGMGLKDVKSGGGTN